MSVPDKREKDKMERKKKEFRRIPEHRSSVIAKKWYWFIIHESTYAITVLQHAEKLRNFLFSLIRVVVNVIFPGLFQINWGNHTSLGTEDNESTDEKKKKHRHNYFPQSFIHIVVNMKQLVPTSSHKLVSQKVWNKCGRFHAW